MKVFIGVRKQVKGLFLGNGSSGNITQVVYRADIGAENYKRVQTEEQGRGENIGKDN